VTVSLDATMIARAAPPGSMRYLATLFTPEPKRALIDALYVVESEILEAARSASHDAAHTRLNWWRTEIDRLLHATPQHPAARELRTLADSGRVNLELFNDVLTAAEMELARFTFANAVELRAYARRCGGVLQRLITAWVAAPGIASPESLDCSERLGAAIRSVETLRDLRQDAADGRVFIPLDTLDRYGVAMEDLGRPGVTPPLRALLAQWYLQISQDIEAALANLPRLERGPSRHSIVLARLHQRLLERIRAREYDVASRRTELGGFERVWVAWRAARAAN
jgi:15-cis-phytoene synthase